MPASPQRLACVNSDPDLSQSVGFCDCLADGHDQEGCQILLWHGAATRRETAFKAMIDWASSH